MYNDIGVVLCGGFLAGRFGFRMHLLQGTSAACFKHLFTLIVILVLCLAMASSLANSVSECTLCEVHRYNLRAQDAFSYLLHASSLLCVCIHAGRELKR